METKSKVVALILVGKKSATAWYVSSDVKSLAICRVVYALGMRYEYTSLFTDSGH